MSLADGGVSACGFAGWDAPERDGVATPKVFGDRGQGTTFAPPDRNPGALLRERGRGSNGRKTYRAHALPATRGLRAEDARRGGEL